MKRRIIMLGIGALTMLALLVVSCTTTLTTTVKTTQPTTKTVTTTGPGPTVPTTITVGTGVFPGGVVWIGQGTYVLPDGKTTVLRPTGTSLTINATITAGVGTYSTVTVLSGIPPVIPHGTTVEGFYGFCFNCHLIPEGHVGRVADQDLCGDCHQQGPIILPR